MDLNMNYFFHGKERTSVTEVDYTTTTNKAINLGDTPQLESMGDRSNNASLKKVNFQDAGDFSNHDDGCRLVLGLGPTPNFYSANYDTSGAVKSKESIVLFSQKLSGSDIGMLKLELPKGTSNAINVTQSNHHSRSPHIGKGLPLSNVDEGSTSTKRKSGGYMPALLFAPRLESVGSRAPTEFHDLVDSASDGSNRHDDCHQKYLSQRLHFSSEPSITTTDSPGTTNDTSVPGENFDHKSNHQHPKKCRFKGCSKGARGVSGLCIAHGGGLRCQKPGCNKGAESRTAYCKSHGGGRRCQQLGCTKSAEGKTDFCITHGGGRRCGHPGGCTKAARGKSGLCIRHGGGKRCTVEGCTRSAEGQKGLCISHGGGRRCQYEGCNKGAQGSTLFCKAHGGGKRCIFEGCNKGAEGSTPLCKGHGGGKRCLYEGGGICSKSVHGGTNFCVAHGGGKRCAVPGCTKSARGRTDYCVRHGGGKRCKFDECGKSAQGSTDFCKAHGGGKRCTWSTGCEKFARGKSGLCAAHGASQQARQSGMGNSSAIGPGLFRGIVSTSITIRSSTDNEPSSSGVSNLSDCVESIESMRRKQPLIPPQVLVPLSMKLPSQSNGRARENSREVAAGSHDKSFGFLVPEGRVHGGGLMSLLGGSLKNSLDGGSL